MSFLNVESSKQNAPSAMMNALESVSEMAAKSIFIPFSNKADEKVKIQKEEEDEDKGDISKKTKKDKLCPAASFDEFVLV